MPKFQCSLCDTRFNLQLEPIPCRSGEMGADRPKRHPDQLIRFCPVCGRQSLAEVVCAQEAVEAYRPETQVQKQVLELLLSGKTLSQIADILCVSYSYLKDICWAVPNRSNRPRHRHSLLALLLQDAENTTGPAHEQWFLVDRGWFPLGPDPQTGIPLWEKLSTSSGSLTCDQPEALLREGYRA